MFEGCAILVYDYHIIWCHHACYLGEIATTHMQVWHATSLLNVCGVHGVRGTCGNGVTCPTYHCTHLQHVVHQLAPMHHPSQPPNLGPKYMHACNPHQGIS